LYSKIVSNRVNPRFKPYYDLQDMSYTITGKVDDIDFNLCFKNSRNFFMDYKYEMTQVLKNINIICVDAIMKCIASKNYIQLTNIYLKINQILISEFGIGENTLFFTPYDKNDNIIKIDNNPDQPISHVRIQAGSKTSLPLEARNFDPSSEVTENNYPDNGTTNYKKLDPRFKDKPLTGGVKVAIHPTLPPPQDPLKTPVPTPEYLAFYQLMETLRDDFLTIDKSITKIPVNMAGKIAMFVYNQIYPDFLGIKKIIVNPVRIDSDKASHPSNYNKDEQQTFNNYLKSLNISYSNIRAENMDLSNPKVTCD
jgi:hypothetical protein